MNHTTRDAAGVRSSAEGAERAEIVRKIEGGGGPVSVARAARTWISVCRAMLTKSDQATAER
jgi:hypothetical protein